MQGTAISQHEVKQTMQYRYCVLLRQQAESEEAQSPEGSLYKKKKTESRFAHDQSPFTSNTLSLNDIIRSSPEKERFEFNMTPTDNQSLSLFLYLYSTPLAKRDDQD
jgi:hypothetical protein